MFPTRPFFPHGRAAARTLWCSVCAHLHRLLSLRFLHAPEPHPPSECRRDEGVGVEVQDAADFAAEPPAAMRCCRRRRRCRGVRTHARSPPSRMWRCRALRRPASQRLYGLNPPLPPPRPIAPPAEPSRDRTRTRAPRQDPLSAAAAARRRTTPRPLPRPPAGLMASGRAFLSTLRSSNSIVNGARQLLPAGGAGGRAAPAAAAPPRGLWPPSGGPSGNESQPFVPAPASAAPRHQTPTAG